MKNPQSLEAFYETHLKWIPEELRRNMGHFNVLRRNTPTGTKSGDLPFGRRDFYKISLFKGRNRIYYADKTIEIERSALLFINPDVPYGVKLIGPEQTGVFCIFSKDFLSKDSPVIQYPVFDLGSMPVYELSEEQESVISGIFAKMEQEISSDFVYKYDVLRNQIQELALTAMKMLPQPSSYGNDSNGATRVSGQFAEILERQFPIESPAQDMRIRSAVDFAQQLSVHVNYLNRALKQTTGRTTTVLITERIIREAKSLLLHTQWNIAEIAWCLGYKSTSHFITSFKKATTLSPSSFRKSLK